MEKTIRIAVLGMGNMGKIHSDHLIQLDGVELVAFCSIPVEEAKNYAEEKKLDVQIFDDFDKMLDQVEFDALYVCLPPYAHNGQVEKAAKKGIHIFIEKPIALSVERAESMAQAVRENNVHSQVGYHMRFGSAVKAFKNLLDNGTAGKPLLFTANYECNSLHTPWWIDVKKCGGQVFEQVIHLYDMAAYIMGEPDYVSGFTANLNHTDVPGYTVEDTSISSIRFKDGGLGGISGSNCAIPGQWNGFFKVVCQNMIAEFTDLNNAKFTFTNDNNRVEEIHEEVDGGFDEDVYFMSVIRGQAPEISPIEEGFTDIKLVAGVVESSGKNGAPVKI